MAIGELLTQLADAGCTLRRLPGDQIEVKGPVPPGLADKLKQHKAALLTVLPDPDAASRRDWDQAIEHANRLLSGTWFGTPEQWAELDAHAERRDAAAYIATAERFRRWQDALNWPDVSPALTLCEVCGFDSTDAICTTCSILHNLAVAHDQKELADGRRKNERLGIA